MPAKPIDVAELQARADAVLDAVAPGAQVAPLTPLQGGTSSITYWTTFTPPEGSPEKVVLKVAPAGLDPVRNRDVLRQARLQRALTGTDVPVPRVLAEHAGSPPDIPPFYVMSFDAGDCVEPNSLPADQALPPEEVRARELHAAAIMGRLHALDPNDVGLGDEPDKTLAEELQTWINSYNAVDEDLQVGSHEVGERLAATIPTGGPTTLIHGDFRLGNTLSEGDHVVSVIDWEIWARSDPRVDLGWFLMMCNPDPALGRPKADGMPSNDELLAAYQQARGATVADLDWFAALVRYKQAAVTALLIRNARRRGDTTTMTPGTALLDSARTLLGM